MTREIGYEVMARNKVPIGCASYTIEVDKTYLKRQKMIMGTRLSTTPIPIFETACRDTKQMKFFRVNDKRSHVSVVSTLH